MSIGKRAVGLLIRIIFTDTVLFDVTDLISVGEAPELVVTMTDPGGGGSPLWVGVALVFVGMLSKDLFTTTEYRGKSGCYCSTSSLLINSIYRLKSLIKRECCGPGRAGGQHGLLPILLLLR